MNLHTYSPPLFFSNGHIQTLFPPVFRKVVGIHYKRERIQTPDGDFIDLDWSCHSGNHLAIISHGLEGNTDRAYVKGMAKALNDNGWDVLAWNYRSCSGTPNRKLHSYHNGVTHDLETVVRHAAKKTGKKIALVGFSMGGNLSLLYLGREKVHPQVKKAIVFSVPCDLKSSAQTLATPLNTFYMKRFLIMLHQKIKEKKKIMPGRLDDRGYHKIKTFKQFDDRYTAPLNGFKNAEDYWRKCSSKPFIPKIIVPTLIINAQNDPFLPQGCFPVDEVRKNKNVHLMMPESGGHVGFIAFNKDNLYWSEKQAVEFFDEL